MPGGVRSNITFRGHFGIKSNAVQVSLLHQMELWTGIQEVLSLFVIGLLNDLEHAASLF